MQPGVQSARSLRTSVLDPATNQAVKLIEDRITAIEQRFVPTAINSSALKQTLTFTTPSPGIEEVLLLTSQIISRGGIIIGRLSPYLPSLALGSVPTIQIRNPLAASLLALAFFTKGPVPSVLETSFWVSSFSADAIGATGLAVDIPVGSCFFMDQPTAGTVTYTFGVAFGEATGTVLSAGNFQLDLFEINPINVGASGG